MEKLKAYLGEDWSNFLQQLKAYLHSDIELLNKVNDSMLANSGKQLRPLISLLMARALGGGQANADSVRYAVSVELLHNATLFHDDVADKSDTRRGRPTLRALLGAESSVLVGDFWLVCALRSIMDSEKGRDRCLSLFAHTLGDLAEGEMLQLQKAGSCDTSMDDYLKVIYCKTASLFVSAATSAAISVGASPELEKAAARYAEYVGYAFQMKDDILDYDGDLSVGKPLGVDILEQKITLPLLGALSAVDAQEQAQIRRKIHDNPAECRDEVLEFVHHNSGVAYAQKVLDDYVAKAIDAISVLPQCPEREFLKQIAEFTAIRNK